MDAAWTVSRLVAAAVPGGWDDRWWHGGGWWWGLWWLVMFALSIGFAAAVVWLVRRRGGPGERR